MISRPIDRRAAMALMAGAVLAGSSARADTNPVDLLLVLAVDASGSVNQVRFDLQKQGYVAAFRDAGVLKAITATRGGAIAITMTQWTGDKMQIVAVPWLRISDAATFAAAADAIDRAPRQLFGGGTSVSGAIDHSMVMFAASPFPGRRRVVDVSGDGANNRGRPAHLARDDAVKADIGINGLPIISLEHDLDTYYRDHVIGGPGAFMIVAESYETFADAVRRKLILEISGLTPGGRPA